MRGQCCLLNIEKRDELLRHIKDHFQEINPNETADRIEQILEVTRGLKANHGKAYSPTTGKPVTKELVGGLWKVNFRQRRWEKQYIPKRPRGRQSIRWPRYLIAMLGKEYFYATGTPPTFINDDVALSKFEAFAKPFLTYFKIQNQKNLIREYVGERKKTNPYSVLK